MIEQLIAIIHEDGDLLVINKLAGLVCHPTKAGACSSLIGRVRLHLGSEARPHLINRLDRETSGVTIVAKRGAAARELRRLWESREVEKEYLAIVRGRMQEEQGTIEAPLGKDEWSRVAIKDRVRPDGLPSRTDFQVDARFAREEGDFTLLRVWPRTGRKHQIRIHLAHVGHPILGDKLYGGDEDLYLALVENRLTHEQRRRLILANHALHARSVRFVWGDRQWEFDCEPEPWFNAFVAGIGDSQWPG